MRDISVIICSFNPVDSYFKACLEAIYHADHHSAVREILIIDNNSDPALHSRAYVQDFLRSTDKARVIIEEAQGLTPARLRGIKEAMGGLIIFIDDDNVINEDFFSEAKKMADKYPFIGAFSGNVILEFEIPPPQWLLRYQGLLVQSVVKHDLWTNSPGEGVGIPCGAGLCITNKVAQYYLTLHETGKRKFVLDRTKDLLLSAGDNDIALCACDIGLGTGLFSSLSLKHMVPAGRMQKDYIKKLVYGIYYSGEILKYMRGKAIAVKSTRQHIRNYLYPFTLNAFDASIYRICQKALADARKWAQANKGKIT